MGRVLGAHLDVGSCRGRRPTDHGPRPTSRATTAPSGPRSPRTVSRTTISLVPKTPTCWRSSGVRASEGRTTGGGGGYRDLSVPVGTTPGSGDVPQSQVVWFLPRGSHVGFVTPTRSVRVLTSYTQRQVGRVPTVHRTRGPVSAPRSCEYLRRCLWWCTSGLNITPE